MAGEPLSRLVDRALELGADGAVIASTDVITVEDHFPELCEPPRCDGYGRSANCPPHVMKPAEFRDLLKRYERILVFRIDVPMEILLAEERADVNMLLQETAAGLERLAAEVGYRQPRGLAAGCCKHLFCSGHDECNILSGGECRNPDRARPSMSGLGVNFNRLSRALGWRPGEAVPKDGPDAVPMGMMVGMVLLG